MLATLSFLADCIIVLVIGSFLLGLIRTLHGLAQPQRFWVVGEIWKSGPVCWERVRIRRGRTAPKGPARRAIDGPFESSGDAVRACEFWKRQVDAEYNASPDQPGKPFDPLFDDLRGNDSSEDWKDE